MHCQPGALADRLSCVARVAMCGSGVESVRECILCECVHFDIGRSSGYRSEEFTYALVVDDLDNSGELLGVDAGAEEDDTADLDESPLAGLDVCVTHFDCLFWRVGSDEKVRRLICAAATAMLLDSDVQ